MKHIVYASLLLILSSAVFSAEGCRELFNKESDQCRTTFRNCLTNPFLESICKAQMENCTNLSTMHIEKCESHQQLCRSQFLDNQTLCKANYYYCVGQPGSINSCADELDNCTQMANDSASSCLGFALRFYGKENDRIPSYDEEFLLVQ